MSESPHPYDLIPSVPEVDQQGGDELPSYEDLAAQNGPNSRCECQETHGSVMAGLNTLVQIRSLEGMDREEVYPTCCVISVLFVSVNWVFYICYIEQRNGTQTLRRKNGIGVVREGGVIV